MCQLSKTKFDAQRVKTSYQWSLTPELSRLVLQRAAMKSYSFEDKRMGQTVDVSYKLQLHGAPCEADVEIARLI